MKRMVELFEVELNQSFFVFDNAAVAQSFSAAAVKGVQSVTACNPLNPDMRVELRPVEARVRRVFVPQSERACVCAFGRPLRPVKTAMLSEVRP